MDIFGIGGAELIVILIIMLVVAGPKRMIYWAYLIGQWSVKMRRYWDVVVDMVQSEVDEAGLDIQVPRQPPTRANINQWVHEASKAYREPLEQDINQLKDLEQEVKSIQNLSSQPQYSSQAIVKQDESESTSQTGQPTLSSNGLGAWAKPQHPSQQKEMADGN